MRTEKDFLGEVRIPDGAYYGIHTARAAENFRILRAPVDHTLIRAMALVKQAAAKTNTDLGYLPPEVGQAIQKAAGLIADGQYADQMVTDAIQGGAGTSTNMNLNEVIANVALEILGHPKGTYDVVHPLRHVNLHQSTNDVYMTSLKVAALILLRDLEQEVVRLQGEFNRLEHEFADVVKLGRTQLMDAVPMTMGQEFGAYAEAFARDRWRLYVFQEKLRQVNLGGTAIGTGLLAPRDYIFDVVRSLRDITRLPLARNENLVDGTQNADVFVEAAGLLNALASNLMKIGNDLRLLASGPTAGLGELRLSAVQPGSSIMPGKVNPVIPEAAVSAAIYTMGAMHSVIMAASMGNLELNAFLPVISATLLPAMRALTGAVRTLRTRALVSLGAHAERCRQYAERSPQVLTALVPYLGYETISRLLADWSRTGVPENMKSWLISGGYITEEDFDRALDPQNLVKLGFDPAAQTPDDGSGEEE